MPENILARIRGEHVDCAVQQLPNAEHSTQDVMQTRLDAAGIGTVLVTAKRMTSKRGKAYKYFWAAKTAVMVA